ncbi:MAG: sulfotransferase [Reyranellaceae bacterium]
MRDDLNCFFIVGAPRAGTTAMARYLKKHPAICFSDPKETHFFLLVGDREPPETIRKRFVDAFFPDLTPQTRILGEGSVSTLYSAEIVERMLRAFPAAKFIVMLRDPVELLRSYHERLVFLRQETVEDFPAAWRLQEARARGEQLPPRCSDPRILQYREVGRLAHYTAQLFRIAGRERCLPVVFDDLVRRTPETYRQVLEFLGLPDDGKRKFKKVNERRRYKSRFLQNLYAGPLLRPVALLMAREPALVARFQRFTKPLRKKFKQMNSVPIEAAALDPRFANELRAEFRAEIEELGRLLGRDLSSWTTPAPEASKPAAA